MEKLQLLAMVFKPLDELRKDLRFGSMPVLMISSRPSSRDVVDAFAALLRENVLGLPLGGEDRLVWMDQVHGSVVAVVDGPQDGPVAGTDALVTATPGLVLGVLAADCVPVLLYDPQRRVIGAVHSGWRGTARNIAGDTSPGECRIERILDVQRNPPRTATTLPPCAVQTVRAPARISPQ